MRGQTRVLRLQPTECGHRGCTDDLEDRWLTWPNAVTVARTLVTVAFWVAAVRTAESEWLVAALACYWVGDIADGLLARITGQETRTGAVLDVLADRLCAALIVITYTGDNPHLAVPACVFLVQFVVLDAQLTLAFGNWSLLSPNYFHLVDPTIWRLNWSLPAKAVNTSAVVLTVLAGEAASTATAVGLAVLAVKVYSLIRLHRLGGPTRRDGCAAREAAAVPLRLRNPAG